MITSIYIKEHQYLIDKPQTLNFGGKFIYSYQEVGRNLIVHRKLNPNYIPLFFNISENKVGISLLSAIVGENGVGKSSILDVIRATFVKHIYSMPHSLTTLIIEQNEETKILASHFDNIYLHIDLDNGGVDYKELEKIDKVNYQSIFYSPHFDLKYNNDFDEVDDYDISLDNFIKNDLDSVKYKGTNENGWSFPLNEELLIKNSMRQIEFLNSNVYRENKAFREVFDIPEYEYGTLYFREFELPKFWNTPRNLQPIIKLILGKLESEYSEWHIYSDNNLDKDDNLRQALVNKYLLERFVIKSFLSVVIRQMEKSNTYLEEGYIENPYDMDRFNDSSALEVFSFFVTESYVEKGASRKSIFKSDDILTFFKKLEEIFSNETDPNRIKKQSIKLELDKLKDVFNLHNSIIANLFHYYPKHDGLINKNNYTEGILSFRPTDKNLSSGENALLNFFSKLYDFINTNLSEKSKSLNDKENYVLLLDEADMGFHPTWKKRYVNVLLKTLPHFFSSLNIIPKLQIIITTHDPLTLSDLPVNNVSFLIKSKNSCVVVTENSNKKIRRTFGANITDLLSHSFFIDSGLIGDFSKSKIKAVIDWIEKNKNISSDRKKNPKFIEELNYNKKVIDLIDEKIVKFKLVEMISDFTEEDEYYNDLIDKEIEFLRRKKR